MIKFSGSFAAPNQKMACDTALTFRGHMKLMAGAMINLSGGRT